MVRSVITAAKTVMTGGVVPSTILVQMDLTSTVYLNTSPDDVEWDSQTWLGAGPLGTIGPAEESQDGQALEFVLSAVPQDMRNVALEEQVRNKDVYLWLAIYEPTRHYVLDAAPLWTGKLDTMSLEFSNNTCSIRVIANAANVEYARIKTLRYTDADQQRLFTGDTSCRFVALHSQHQVVWPAAEWFKKNR